MAEFEMMRKMMPKEIDREIKDDDIINHEDEEEMEKEKKKQNTLK